jgi:glycosyltransferase involved in cell wall biosynthesis
MIVKDEAPRIERLLASTLPHIDHAAIVDTGSTDGTVELIERFCAEHDLPLTIEQREWTDFATARNQALDISLGRCDYILALDADWTMEVTDPAGLENLHADGYLYAIDNPGTGTIHYNERLLRDDPSLEWRWVHPVHEQPHSPRRPVFYKLEGVIMRVDGSGGQRTERYERDIELLTRALEADPTDQHAVYYLGNSHLVAGRNAEATRFYYQLLSMPIRSRVDRERRYFALMRLGEFASDPDEAISIYERATRLMDHRQEAAVRMVSLLREQGQVHRALIISRRERPVPGDNLNVAPWVYEWGMACERALLAAQAGHLAEAERTCQALLNIPSLPAEQRGGVQELLVHIAQAKLEI